MFSFNASSGSPTPVAGYCEGAADNGLPAQRRTQVPYTRENFGFGKVSVRHQ